MKTQFKSLISVLEDWSFRLGKFCLLGLLAMQLSCSSTSKRSSEPREKKDYSEVPEELSLKEDRSYLEKLREDVPDDTKKDNDELAFIMKMMGEVKERPDKIRDRWNTETRKRRDRFQKLNAKDREEFTKNEKKDRESFLKEVEKERSSFSKKKVTSEERREFFGELDSKRREFFSKQQDLRKDFESQMRERSTDFEAYMRDRNNEFNAENRAYGERYRQWEKERKDFDISKQKYEQEKRANREAGGSQGASAQQVPAAGSGLSAEDQKLLQEFDQIPGGPRQKLQSGGDDGK